MGSRGRLGGVAEATALAVAVLDCAGFDVVLVETVGAGQSDTRVADLVDVVVLALQPGSGDSVQAIKAGVMEIPDVVALTKSDLPGVDAFRGELRLALGIDPERAPLLVEAPASSRCSTPPSGFARASAMRACACAVGRDVSTRRSRPRPRVPRPGPTASCAPIPRSSPRPSDSSAASSTRWPWCG
jgi:hypothetical protein